MEFFVKPGTDEEWHQYWIDHAHRLVHRPRHRAREPAALRAPEGEAVALLEAHRRHRVPLRLPGQRVGRARGHRQPHGLRPEDPHRALRAGPVVLRPGDERRWYGPYVIEPAAGLTRSMMAFLVEAYAEDEAPNTKGGVDKRTVLRLDPRLAPVKAAVLPLSRNSRPVAEGPGPGRRAAQELERRVRRRRRDRPALPPAGRDRHAVLRHGRLRHARRPGRHHPGPRLHGAGAGRPRPGRRLPGAAPRRRLTRPTPQARSARSGPAVRRGDIRHPEVVTGDGGAGARPGQDRAMTFTDTLPTRLRPDRARWRSTSRACTSPSAASAPSTGSTWRSRPARSSRSSVPTAPARPRRSTCCWAWPARTPARCPCSGIDPNRAIAEGRVSAVMQTAACSRTSRSARPSSSTASFFRASRPVDEVLARAGIADIADRRSASARAVSSSGCGSRSRCCPTRT